MLLTKAEDNPCNKPCILYTKKSRKRLHKYHVYI